MEIEIEDNVESEVEAHGRSTGLPPIDFEVVQQVLDFLSGLARIRATSTVQTTQVQITLYVATIVPKMDKASGSGTFFYLLLAR